MDVCRQCSVKQLLCHDEHSHSKRRVQSHTREHITEGTAQQVCQSRVISQQDSLFLKLFLLLIVLKFQEQKGPSRVQMPERSQNTSM